MIMMADMSASGVERGGSEVASPLLSLCVEVSSPLLSGVSSPLLCLCVEVSSPLLARSLPLTFPSVWEGEALNDKPVPPSGPPVRRSLLTHTHKHTHTHTRRRVRGVTVWRGGVSSQWPLRVVLSQAQLLTDSLPLSHLHSHTCVRELFFAPRPSPAEYSSTKWRCSACLTSV